LGETCFCAAISAMACTVMLAVEESLPGSASWMSRDWAEAALA